VLVTGGAGFIGSNLVRTLVARGHSVSVLDDLSTGREANLEGVDAELHVGSILDDAALQDAAASASSIVHLAALPSVPRSIKNPLATHEANATGTLRVLEVARRRMAQVISASSSSVYGANPVLPKREDLRPQPVSPYAVSKLAAESYVSSYQRIYGLPTLPFRFFNVYGPHQAAGHVYAAVIPVFVSAALAGEPLVVHGDGRQTRDFTHIDSVVGALVEAVERRVTSVDPVNLAFGTRSTLLEVIDHLCAVLGHDVEVRHVEPRSGDVRDSQADVAALRALFPDVAPVPLRTGIESTVTWMRSELQRSGVGPC
jgi:UDP-glucose 4-epimerase